jgi:hypothetical protein
MRTFKLSKSSFLRGVQCEKSLYLHRHYPELRDELSEEQQTVFERGTNVGLLARQLFPGGEDASPEDYSRFFDSITTTKKLIKDGAKIIYEAAFEYNNTVAAIDILVKTRNGWKGYEVKSTTGLKDIHFLDAAVQYYVITGSGIDLKDISIVHLNNGYVRCGDLDISSLFTVQCVKKEVLGLLDTVEERIPKLLSVLRKKSIPDIPIGPHCSDSYDCDFIGHCWKHVPEHSVFEIAGLRSDKKFELYGNGFLTMTDIPDDYRLSDRQRVQIDALRSGRSYIDKQAVGAFLRTLSYPLYFFDLETFNPAIPLYDNSRPYQQIPFQFSIHYKKSAISAPKHIEYLADAGADPRLELIQHFLEDTKTPGDIIVYNKSFEGTRLNELTRDFPSYASGINERIERIKDLMDPFRSKSYYTPGMHGSHSIKYVMPELVPGLTYDTLEIGNGGAAMNAFDQMVSETDPKKIARTRKALLEYCKLDTLAMVRILEVLEGVNN